MKQVPDRKRLRQEYLRRKTDAYARMMVSAFLTLAGIALLALFGVFNLNYRAYMDSVILFLIGAIILVVVAVNAAAARHFGIRRELDSIPYVPPVTADTLPADAILVRGSEEPAVAQSEVLLRAAKEQETPKEELLRVNQE